MEIGRLEQYTYKSNINVYYKPLIYPKPFKSKYCSFRQTVLKMQNAFIFSVIFKSFNLFTLKKLVL